MSKYKRVMDWWIKFGQESGRMGVRGRGAVESQWKGGKINADEELITRVSIREGQKVVIQRVGILKLRKRCNSGYMIRRRRLKVWRINVLKILLSYMLYTDIEALHDQALLFL